MKRDGPPHRYSGILSGVRAKAGWHRACSDSGMALGHVPSYWQGQHPGGAGSVLSHVRFLSGMKFNFHAFFPRALLAPQCYRQGRAPTAAVIVNLPMNSMLTS